MTTVQPLYIHGQYAQASSGACLTTCNPATGELLARVQIAAPPDIDRAVDSATQGFKVWSATG